MDFAHEIILFGLELVHFHQFEECQEGHNDFDFGGRFLEESLQGHLFSRFEIGQEEIDFVADSVAVIDDVSEVSCFLESFENVLKCQPG